MTDDDPIPFWNRIVLLGLPGCGKSFLAREIGRRLNLEPVHLDRLFATAEGANEAKPEWEDQMRHLASGPRWIIDGHYTDTIPIRVNAADTVIFVDQPVWLCLLRTWRRQGQPRPDWPAEVAERRDREFFSLLRYIVASRHTVAGDVYNAFGFSASKAALIHLGGRRANRRFLRLVRSGQWPPSTT